MIFFIPLHLLDKEEKFKETIEQVSRDTKLDLCGFARNAQPDGQPPSVFQQLQSLLGEATDLLWLQLPTDLEHKSILKQFDASESEFKNADM